MSSISAGGFVSCITHLFASPSVAATDIVILIFTVLMLIYIDVIVTNLFVKRPCSDTFKHGFWYAVLRTAHPKNVTLKTELP